MKQMYMYIHVHVHVVLVPVWYDVYGIRYLVM